MLINQKCKIYITPQGKMQNLLKAKLIQQLKKVMKIYELTYLGKLLAN